ncbi:MAG: ribosome-associated translation inhibitor RaiA [Bdellovibrionaceae bacterium]|nr:ribosome-associated translation inhibitor RaiA [Bdellovibrionales bacterium]MCB9082746.1 ribosome-associated translation inhibitor RaiA [Pseudobdellovibrionaceae bacterium]
MFNIISEDFDLTPAIREGIKEKVDQVNEHLRKEHSVSVYLSKTSDQLFTVRMNVRLGKKNITSSDTDRDFYAALAKAKDHLIRQVDRRNKKRIAMRHRQN